MLLSVSLAGQVPPALRARLEARIDSTAATGVGLYYQDLRTGETLSVDGLMRFHAASTMKLPVMIQLFRDRDAGTISLADSLMVHDTFPSLVDGSPFTVDKSDDSDSTLYGLVGHRVSVSHLLELMETVSSNLATDVLIERIGAERANATAHALGADSILVLRGVEDGKAYRAGKNNTTTARDLGVLLAAVDSHRAASAASCDSMLAILSRQHFAEGIPSGLPAGAKVYHKTGWIEGVVYHDAAIVTLPDGRHYVLVVLTGGIKKDEDAYRLVADLSRIIAG
jgi:beta-lactamase class A